MEKGRKWGLSLRMSWEKTVGFGMKCEALAARPAVNKTHAEQVADSNRSISHSSGGWDVQGQGRPSIRYL